VAPRSILGPGRTRCTTFYLFPLRRSPFAGDDALEQIDLASQVLLVCCCGYRLDTRILSSRGREAAPREVDRDSSFDSFPRCQDVQFAGERGEIDVHSDQRRGAHVDQAPSVWRPSTWTNESLMALPQRAIEALD
jgi:hypothetical protein